MYEFESDERKLDCYVVFFRVPIAKNGKCHNTLCLSTQILKKHCFQFLLGLTVVPRENKNNAYSKFGWTNKEYYGIFRFGQFPNCSEFMIIVNLEL